jgi:predicted amidophosphoribosyltransferase
VKHNLMHCPDCDRLLTREDNEFCSACGLPLWPVDEKRAEEEARRYFEGDALPEYAQPKS